MKLQSGMRALVTGGGSGLGRALALELGEKGLHVIVADIREDLATATTHELTCRGHRADFLRCDVSLPNDVQAMGSHIENTWGPVDLLVNNAGVAVVGDVGGVSLSDWQFVVGVNLWGVIYGCHEYVPRMKARRSGYILNVASAAGIASPPQMGPYNVTKAGVIALSETLAVELSSFGVGVTVLCPSFFQTNLLDAARSSDPVLLREGADLMARSTLSANDVAHAALVAVEHNTLYALPHKDSQWIWRMKRASPSLFASLLTTLEKRGLIHPMQKREKS